MNKVRCNNVESLALSRKSAILTSSRKSPTSMLQRYKWGGTCVTIVAMRLGCQTPEQVA